MKIRKICLFVIISILLIVSIPLPRFIDVSLEGGIYINEIIDNKVEIQIKGVQWKNFAKFNRFNGEINLYYENVDGSIEYSPVSYENSISNIEIYQSVNSEIYFLNLNRFTEKDVRYSILYFDKNFERLMIKSLSDEKNIYIVFDSRYSPEDAVKFFETYIDEK